MVVAQLTTDNRENDRQYGEPAPKFGTAPEALLQGFAHWPEIKVHVICCTQQPVAAPTKLAENIWYHSLHVPKFGWMRTGYQGCIRAVRQRLRELKPDIVHGQGTERECAISAVFSGYPNVVTIHGNMRLISQVNRARPFSYQWLAAQLETIILPRANGVVCITDYTRRAVTDLNRRTWVIHNAVDETFFAVTKQPAKPELILCVGQIIFRKNQHRLIQALDALAAQRPFQLLFLGEARQEDNYGREFFRLLQTRPWCRHGGVASRAQLKEQLSQAAALVLPSLEDNCPMVLLEAMASGVPVTAARVGGVPELIAHRQTGILFDPLVSADITKAVRQILENPSAAERMAEAGKTEALTRFHPKEIARGHLEVYREVLASLS